MFAERGIDGVALRQIGAEIGFATPNVVAYHFGGKDELVTEIFKCRLETIEARRKLLLIAAEASGRGYDQAALLHALWRPLMDQRDSNGRHSFAAFLLGSLRSRHMQIRRALHDAYPATKEIVQRLKDSGPDLSEGEFQERILMTLGLVCIAFELMDQATSLDDDADKRQEAIFVTSLKMAGSALYS
jgi:AcrR family transcriptional regulator